jgi:hypothetical protein
MKSAPQEGSQTAFVMMPFRAEFDDVYSIVTDSIAAVDESMNVIRLDEVRAAGSITQDLVEMIRKSTLCLADVTGANPNVMWEVGFAAALGKPVIAITQQNGAQALLGWLSANQKDHIVGFVPPTYNQPGYS